MLNYKYAQITYTEKKNLMRIYKWMKRLWYYCLWIFYTSANLPYIPRNLIKRKSPQVSRTLFSILADLNNILTLIISARSLIYIYSNLFSKPLRNVPRKPATVVITVTLYSIAFLIHRDSLSTNHSFCFLLFSHSSLPGGGVKLSIRQIIFFLLTIVWASGRD